MGEQGGSVLGFWRTPRMPEKPRKKPEIGRRKVPQQKPMILRWIEEINPRYVIGAIILGIIFSGVIISALAPNENQAQTGVLNQVSVETVVPTPIATIIPSE